MPSRTVQSLISRRRESGSRREPLSTRSRIPRGRDARGPVRDPILDEIEAIEARLARVRRLLKLPSR